MLPINSPLRMLTGRPPRPHGHRPHGRFRRRRRRPSPSRVESECRRILPGVSRPLCVVATSEWPNRDRSLASRRRDLSTKPWTGHQVEKVFFFRRRKCGRNRRPNFKIGRRKETESAPAATQYIILASPISFHYQSKGGFLSL
jgi:hypothetical protein